VEEVRFSAHVLSVLLLIGIWGVAQSAPTNGAKKQVSEFALQRHVYGFVYCPSGSADGGEISLHSHKSLSAQIPRVRTDENGYFDFGNVSIGKYELIVENRCATTAASVNKFEVTVQSSTTTSFKDCVPGEVVIKLNERSDPEISYRLKLNASCG
jgi:hypothetical protein